MIKKLAIFVVLLGGGFAVMHFVIGAENFATIGATDESDPIKETTDEGRGQGFVVEHVDDTDENSAITVTTSGPLSIPSTREVLLPNGNRRLIDRYVLVAKDSRPHPDLDDQMQLFDVTVELFEVDFSDPANPQPQRAGTLVADEAILQVGRDEKGRPSVREDRDMYLTGVVVRSDTGARVDDLVMRVPRVFVRHTAAGLALRTPDDDTDFEIQLGGDDPMDLTGHGLRAMLPDEASDAPDKRIELHVAKDPLLVRGTSRLSATGRLDYVEDLATGIGRIDLVDDVKATGLLGGASARAVTATGDTLHAKLARRAEGKSATRGSAAWLEFFVVGEPVELVSDDGVLACERLDAWPGIDGEPVFFTAAGSATLTQGENASFHASRIHLVRIDKFMRSIYGSFGFPRHYGRIAEQMFVFEDATRVLQKADGTRIDADLGMHVVRSSAKDGPSVSLGFGDVAVEREGLVANGNDGFVLASDGERQRLRLGPAEDDGRHAFTIERATDDGNRIDVRGTGTCELERGDDGSTLISMRSRVRDLFVAAEGAELRDVEHQVVELDADGEIVAFTAFGAPCRIERETEDEAISGEATEFRLAAGGDMHLVGTPAWVRRGVDDSVVRGGRIDIHPYGRQRFVVEVWREAGRRAHATVIPPAPQDGTTAAATDPIELDADHIALLPTLLPHAAALAHSGYARGAWSRVFAAGLRSQHVFATGDVAIRQASDERTVEAFGERFVTRVEGETGTLFGDPADVVQRGEDGAAQTTAEAPVVHVGRNADGESLALLPAPDRNPVLVMRGLTQGGSDMDLRLECDGMIDTRDGEVVFHAPVDVVEIDEDGEPVPDGLRMNARALRLALDENREVEKLLASDGTEFSVRGVVARGERATVDIRHSRATITDERDRAHVRLPNGVVWSGTWLEVDYVNLLVTAWHSRIDTR